MNSIPRDLANDKAVLNYIDDLISFDGAKDFASLDDLQQDQLVALGIAALGADIEMILSTKANIQLAKYLTTYDRDEEIELTKAIRDSAREYFAQWFDEMIQERIHDRFVDFMHEIGKRAVQDPVNGETRWL